MSTLAEIHDHREIDLLFKAIDGMATRAINEKRPFYVQYGTDKKMTEKQRGALHVWCDQVARTLNANNLFHRKIHPFTGVEMEVPWVKESVKQDLYKPTLESFTEKTSTEHQSTVDPSIIAEALAVAYAKTFGVVLPFWPSRNCNKISHIAESRKFGR